jgi:hypothetical protein
VMKRILNRLGNMTYLQRIALLSVAGELFLASCANGYLTKLKFEEFPTLSVDQYHYTEIHEGLAIAIQPMIISNDTEKYFGADLLADGTLAVFVLAENRSANLSYLVRKENIRLYPGNVTSNDPGPDRVARSRAGGIAGATFLAGPFMGYLLPVYIVGLKMKSNTDEIAYNLALKELQTKMVSPSSQMSGFVYFNVPKNPDSDKWTLRVEALEPTTKAVTVFNIGFPWRRR